MLLTGFLTGILASFHCFGMCGPLNSAFLFGHGNTSFFLYHTGRILVYAIFGLLAGLFGSAFQWAGLQQYISIISGVVILIVLFITVKGNSAPRFLFPVRWRNKIISFFSSLDPARHTGHYFLLGMLNGLLPCGIIYTALALAVSAGSIGMGVLVMAAFGAGTFPAFLLLKVASARIKANKAVFRKVNIYVTLCVGFLLILRGANMGIPYLSPQLKENGLECCTKK